jgi:gliding motility-associated-like protein
MRSIKYKITRHSVWGMRRGPDDQVYIILDTFPRNLSRIQNPNLLGATCNFQENFLSTGFSADNRNIGLGNNFISRFKGYYDSTFYNSTYSFCSGYSKTISGSGYDYYHWFDGDTSKAKTFTKAGKYWLVSGNYCEKRIDTFNIIEQAPTYSFNKKDTLICPRSWITISGRPTFDSFVWFDGNKKITRNVFGLSGNYWVKSIRDCEVIIDTFHFIEQPIATIKNFYEITQCLGLQTFLFGKSGVDNYKWSTGDTTNNIYVYSPGKYWTMSIKDCILFVDTFYVKYIPYSTTKIEIDTPICFQDNATILAPSSFDTYLWNSGSTKKDTSLFTSSKVSVVATNNTTCQILKKTYNVDFVSFITNSRDTFTCNQDTIILDATVNVPNATYRWKTGETTPSIKVTKAGTKIIFVTVLGCTGTDTFEVKNKTIPIDIGEDQIVCEGQKIILSANIDDAKYHWNTGAETKTIEVFKSGVYSISVSKDDCFAGDEVNIYFDICDNCIAFPNAFTPNGDGINDYFKPIINCNTSSFEFTLFNRWGQEIFASNNPNQKWDGTWLGQVQDNGVYFYMLKVKFTAQDQTEKMYNGELTLIR